MKPNEMNARGERVFLRCGSAALVIAIGLYAAVKATDVRATAQNRSTLEERNAAEMQEAARRRKLIELIELRNFRDNGRDVFDLAQDLLVITNSPIDAQARQAVEKTAKLIESKTGKMKQYLGGKKTHDDNRSPARHNTLAEAVQALAITLNDLRADLLKAGLGQTVTLDIRLRESLSQQLDVVQLTAAEIRRLR